MLSFSNINTYESLTSKHCTYKKQKPLITIWVDTVDTTTPARREEEGPYAGE